MGKLSDILNYKFTLKARLQLYLLLIGLRGLWALVKFINNKRKHYKMLRLASVYQRERQERFSNIRTELPSFSEEQIEKILNSDVGQLKELLKKKQVTSRCLDVGVSLNCITEFNFEDALATADTLDKLRESNPEILDQQPLFGVPVSIKDFFDLKGLPATVGCINKIKNVPIEDGFVVKLIRNSGGIPFVKTNVPQLGLSFESANRIYGRTLNPWDRTRYPGGSSGGESAAVSARCSPIGIGSDLGGSVRSPACFTGLYSFKPTSGRFPLSGLTFYSPTNGGEMNIRTSLGPIAKSIDDCVLMIEAFSQNFQNYKLSESTMHQVIKPFDKIQYQAQTKKLKIGYFKTIPLCDASVSNQRAVDISIEVLRSLGHELVEVSIPNVDRATNVFFEIAACDNLKNFDFQRGDEELMDVYKPALNPFHFPFALKKIIAFLLKVFGEKRKSNLLLQMKKGETAEGYLRKIYEVMSLRKQVVKYLEDQEITALVTPCFACPPLHHLASSKALLATSYLSIWNVLNFPAGVLPVTTVNEDEQHYNNSRIQDSITRTIQASMSNTAGLPVNIQVVTLPHQDELCLNLMKQIDGKTQFYKNHKYPI